MNHNISMKSISDFEKQDAHFYIPSYQRGYRWKKKQVLQLINDIDEFIPTETTPFYFLQALAVANDIKNQRINIVDGQQRLTTLKLILGNEYNGIKLEYAREADKALDKYFKEEAINVIESRLGDLASSMRKQFCEKLKFCCRFLFYEVDGEKELSTFDELNGGKIPAKDSELVKCILLTLGSDESQKLTEARAKEWDEIERMLNNEDFFAFMTPQKTKREDDRMTVVLRYAGFIPSENEFDEELFPFLSKIQDRMKTISRESVWKNICAAYYRLLEWYNDPLMYHAFGTIVHRKGHNSIDSIVEGKNIIAAIEQMSNYEQDTDSNDYKKGGSNLYNYLLLSNVAYCWKRWPNRYSFKKHREINEWSLEHIFARNQRNLTEDELKEWLGGDDSKEKFTEYAESCKNEKGDEWLAQVLGDKYPTEEDNSIRNLAILPKNANSSLNNKLFEGKRNEICKWANESWTTYWAPPITEAIFMKSLVGLNMGQPYWSEDDKTAYETSMDVDIKSFIKKLKQGTTL